MAEPRRVHVSSYADLASRYRAFLVPGGIEVEERASFEIVRRRILFDEIHAVTLHTARRWSGAIALGLVALIFLLMALAFSGGGESETALVFLALGLGLALPAVVLLAVPAHVITIYGRRARVRVVFRFGARKAREWLARLSREIERAQAQQRAAGSTP